MVDSSFLKTPFESGLRTTLVVTPANSDENNMTTKNWPMLEIRCLSKFATVHRDTELTLVEYCCPYSYRSYAESMYNYTA